MSTCTALPSSGKPEPGQERRTSKRHVVGVHQVRLAVETNGLKALFYFQEDEEHEQLTTHGVKMMGQPAPPRRVEAVVPAVRQRGVGRVREGQEAGSTPDNCHFSSWGDA